MASSVLRRTQLRRTPAPSAERSSDKRRDQDHHTPNKKPGMRQWKLAKSLTGGNNRIHQRACFGSSTSEGVDFFCRRVNESVRFLVVGVGSAGVVGDASDDAVVDAPESTGVGNLSSGAASSPARGVLPLSPLFLEGACNRQPHGELRAHGMAPSVNAVQNRASIASVREPESGESHRTRRREIGRGAHLLRLVNESERLSLVMTPGLAFAAAAASAC